jgi:DNA-binding HxlR family transcriptional regulator/catechol 2,3-dioxygenase-like lactoylglutathione lyase family enzyme
MSLSVPQRPVPGFQTSFPIVAALDLLGRRWILRILWELRTGPMGFRALQALCDQMSPSLLSQRLTVLQTTGLIHHSEEGTYQLTDVGKALLQALAPLQEWAEQWAEQLSVQEETERAQAHQERSRLPMSLAPDSQPTFLTIAPRFVVQNMEQALAFYGQLGFQTMYHDEHFAIVARDGVDLHFNCYPDSPRSHGVCWIAVTHIDALYQQYLPTNAVQSAPEAKPWGFKEFFLRDPFGNLILFDERLPEGEAGSEQGG